MIYADAKQEARCRSCGRLIVWAILKSSGERHPFDKPLIVTGTQPDLFIDRPVEFVVSASHFATCPSAALHRRKGAAS